MIAYVLIALTSLIASGLTFFSGFGLGTILTPVFAVFFDLPIAVALTAIVHFLNNLFKLILIGKHANRSVILQFGIPSLLFAFAGAYLLEQLSHSEAVYTYMLGETMKDITPVEICIAVLIFFFALQDLIPRLSIKKMEGKTLWIGGALSGFFGGLSGHQGALRSSFLVQANLSKEAFVATGTVIACIVDVARISIYLTVGSLLTDAAQADYTYVVVAVFAAFGGALIGRQLLKKVTLRFVQMLVGLLLLLMSIAIGVGLI